MLSTVGLNHHPWTTIIIVVKGPNIKRRNFHSRSTGQLQPPFSGKIAPDYGETYRNYPTSSRCISHFTRLKMMWIIIIRMIHKMKIHSRNPSINFSFLISFVWFTHPSLPHPWWSSVLLFQFALPAIQVILFCICIGADPFNIPVAIVNEEDPPFLSKLFLDKLDPYLVHQVIIIDLDLISLSQII